MKKVRVVLFIIGALIVFFVILMKMYLNRDNETKSILTSENLMQESTKQILEDLFSFYPYFNPWMDKTKFAYFGSVDGSTNALEESYPQAVRRETSDGGYYMLDYGEGRLYTFYRNYAGGSVIWGRTLYMENVLNYKDFSGITVGTEADRVAKLDHAAGYVIENAKKEGDSEFYTYHLLKDGVMEITYRDFAIKEINYYKDFQMPSVDALTESEDSMTVMVDYHIKEEDYIK